MKEVEKEFCIFLDKKLMQFKQYQSVTEMMKHTLCGKEKDKEISSLISKRQSCISAIEKINGSLEKIVNKGSDGFSRIPSKYKRLIDGYMSSIKDVMMQIDLMDRELVAVVAEKSKSLKTEILKLRNMKQAARGYGSHIKYPARFLDTRR